MNSLGRLPREPSDGGPTPFTGRRTKLSVIVPSFAKKLPMKGMQTDRRQVHSRDTTSMMAIRWHMSREEKNQVSLSGAHGISSRTPCVVHRALTEMHVPLRHSLRAQRCTKRGRRIKANSSPKVPSTRRSEENGKGQDRKGGKRKITKKSGVFITHIRTKPQSEATSPAWCRAPRRPPR